MAEVTILFTDIKDSTVIAAALGDIAYTAQMRNPHFEALQKEITEHNGHVFQDKGDGVIAYFPTAADAVATAVILQTKFHLRPQTATDETGQTHSLQARMGLHTGAANPDGTPGGNALNYTSRIEALADAGQIILSDAACTALGTPPYPCKPWSDRYLKGITTLEPVYELDYDGVRRPEPGTRTLPNNYTPPANAYIPRPEKEDEVVRLFETALTGVSKARLITLRAEGGMGKTRMAVTCAAQIYDQFPQGVWFVPLAEVIPDRQAVAEAIASALKLPTKTKDYLSQYLRQSRGILLILDNVESVTCESVIELVEGLLADAPDLYLLATGREKLGCTHLEKEVTLNAGMTLGEPQNLFLERVRLSDKPAPDNDSELAGLLKLTAYIPLAIELLAAWWDNYGTVTEMAADYGGAVLGPLSGDPVRRSRTDSPSAKQRQLSLTDSLNWSWRKLGQVEDGPEAQRLFAVVSLFAAPFTAEVASIISQQSPIRPLLDRLLRASLIRLETGSNPTRYSLHRFTREYGQSQLSSKPHAAEIRQRFVDYYVQQVDKNKNINDAICRDYLTAEWQSAIGAVETAEKIQDWQSVLWFSNLGEFLDLRGLWADQELLYERALIASQALKDKRGEAQMLNNLGNVYRNQGRWNRAETSCRQSLPIFQSLNDKYGEAQTLGNLGTIYQKQRRRKEAIETYQQSLTIFLELGNRQGEAQTLNCIGNVYQSLARWNEAIELFQQSLAIFQDLGNRQGEALALGNLGNIYQSQRRWNEAIEVYQQSLDISRDIGDKHGEAWMLTNVGIVYKNQGRLSEAVNVCQQSVLIFQILADKHGQAQTLTNLGNIYQSQMHWDEAIKVYQQSLVIRRKLGDKYGEGLTLGNLGVVYQSQGRWDEAEDCLQQALTSFQQVEDKHGEAQTLQNLSALMIRQEKWPEAITFSHQAVAAYGETEDVNGLAEAKKKLDILKQILGQT